MHHLNLVTQLRRLLTLLSLIGFFLTAALAVCFRAHADSTDLAYFSNDYPTARARFQSSAEKMASSWPLALRRSFKVPSQVDQDLTVDYLYLPAQVKTERLLVITSGVHGIEGYTGSAIQLMMLHEFADEFDRQRTGYLFVHAVNPYGFKFHRRATESSVNLNRNFSTMSDMYLKENEAYAKISNQLEPQGQVTSPIARIVETSFGLGSQIISGKLSLSELTKGIGEGQYQFPRGLEYGGHENEPQTKDFISYLAEISQPYQDIIMLDLHTGLGESYQLHLMPGDAGRSVDPILFEKLFNITQDSSIYKYTPNTAAGFYPTTGDITNLLPQIMGAHQRAVSITMEFGTIGNGPIPKLKTVNRLILENQGFHFGYSSSHVQQHVQASFDELFFPKEAFWRTNVMIKSRSVLSKVLRRLKQNAATD